MNNADKAFDLINRIMMDIRELKHCVLQSVEEAERFCPFHGFAGQIKEDLKGEIIDLIKKSDKISEEV